MVRGRTVEVAGLIVSIVALVLAVWAFINAIRLRNYAKKNDGGKNSLGGK